MKEKIIGIDIGNTLTKIYNLSTAPPSLISRIPTPEVEDLEDYATLIIASVREDATKIWEERYKDAILISRDMPWPFRISPGVNMKTVGIDRLLALAGTDISTALIVMLGTATVINIKIKNIFIGGAISPGIDAVYEALTYKAPTLKKFSPRKGSLIGKTSEEAIYSGTYLMQALWIEKYNSLVGNLPIIYTGGSYTKLKDILPHGTYIPYLIAAGMKKLLQNM